MICDKQESFKFILKNNGLLAFKKIIIILMIELMAIVCYLEQHDNDSKKLQKISDWFSGDKEKKRIQRYITAGLGVLDSAQVDFVVDWFERLQL